MRSPLLFSLALLFFAQLAAQDAYTQPAWEWATTNSCNLTAVTTDAAGNVYATGNFTSATITFGTYTLSNATFTEYPKNLFLVKYDPFGNVLWAVAPGYWPDNDYFELDPAAITTDAGGNVYICGIFRCDEVLFSSALDFSASPHFSAFVVKYDAAGNALWAFEGITNRPLACNSIASDALGHITISGSFIRDIGIGPAEIHGPNDTTSMYIVQYDTAGHPIWGQAITNVYSSSSATDQAGNTAATGIFTGAAGIGATTLTSTAPSDILIARLDTGGNLTWAKHIAAGSAADAPAGITTDPAGNIIITGNYTNPTLSFDAINLVKNDTDSTDIFVVKYDAAGDALWAATATGRGNDYGKAVACDAWGNIFVTGSYTSPALNFPAGTIINHNTDSFGRNYDVFIAKYDASGTNQYAVGNGGAGSGEVSCMAVDPGGAVYVGGNFGGAPFIFGSTTLPPQPATEDMFLAKFSGTTAVPLVTAAAYGISVYPNPAGREVGIITSAAVLHTVTILDIRGHCVGSYEQVHSRQLIQLPALSNGNYILHATGDNFAASVPFSVSR